MVFSLETGGKRERRVGEKWGGSKCLWREVGWPLLMRIRGSTVIAASNKALEWRMVWT